MRTISTAQEDVLTSPKYDVHSRLEVENSTGGFDDIASLGGGGWFESARWQWDLDQPVAEMTIELRRDSGLSSDGESLAPLDEESTLNRTASSSYAPLLDPGREYRFYTAALSPGSAAPASSEFDYIFNGEIDDVLWERSPLSFIGRSKIMASLQDRWVEESTRVYGSSSGTAVESVIQEIIADYTDLSTDILWTPTSPGFLITPYEQQKMPVLEAVSVLKDLIGWDVRDVYDDNSTQWRLKFFEPNRTASSSDKDWTFDASQYFDVQQMSISRDDVRNVVNVIYGPSSSRASVEAQSTASIDRYGRRWMEIEEGSDSPISSSSEANTLATAVLDDLKDARVTHEIEVPYWWPGELSDYYEFEANLVHYSTDQFLSPYGLRHELSRERHRTLVAVRGQPAGQYLRWRKYPGGGSGALPVVTGAEVDFDATGQAVVSAAASTNAAAIYVEVGDGVDPSDPSTSSSVISGSEGSVDTGTKITTGNEARVKLRAANAAGSLGEIRSSKFSRRVSPFHKDTTTRSHTGDTSETTLETITIPANTLGTNGSIRIELRYEFVGTAGNHTLKVKLNTDTIFGFVTGSAIDVYGQVLLFNDGATNDQQAVGFQAVNSGSVNLINNTTLAEDSTADMDIVITAQLTNGADQINLVMTHVTMMGTN